MSKNSIILLEDEPVIVWDLQLSLWQLGYEVIAVDESYDAFDCNQSRYIDACIICNLKLIGGWMDAYQLMKIKSRCIIFIVSTGYTGSQTAFFSKHFSANLLQKPFSIHQLKAILSRA